MEHQNGPISKTFHSNSKSRTITIIEFTTMQLIFKHPEAVTGNHISGAALAGLGGIGL